MNILPYNFEKSTRDLEKVKRYFRLSNVVKYLSLLLLLLITGTLFYWFVS